MYDTRSCLCGLFKTAIAPLVFVQPLQTLMRSFNERVKTELEHCRLLALLAIVSLKAAFVARHIMQVQT